MQNRRGSGFLLLLLLISCLSKAQQFTPYYLVDSVSLDNYIAESSGRLDAMLVAPKDADKEFKRDIEEIKKDSREHHSSMLKNDFLADTVLHPYVEKIFKKIQAANPVLAGQHFFLSANSSPNAVSFGEGTVMLYMGLLLRLENENEVAFVLCHELAHNYLEHSTKTILNTLASFHEKQFKKDLRKAVRSEYNVHQKVDEVLSKLSYNKLYHSRESEVQADSMGMIFFQNAGYGIKDGLRALAILDSVDEPLYKSNVSFQSIFSCSDFPYRDEWSSYKEIKGWVAKDDMTQEMKDSLKTHPDCAKRIAMMRTYFHAESVDISGSYRAFSSASFEPFRMRAEFEVLQRLFVLENYGKSLHLAMQMLIQNPQSDFLRSVISLSLYEIYVHEKKHLMQDVVELPDSKFPENYNRLLTLLERLSLSDLAGVTYCSLQSYKPADENSEYFLAAKFASASAVTKKEETEAAQKNYIKLFPKGKFISMISPEETPNSKIKTKTKTK